MRYLAALAALSLLAGCASKPLTGNSRGGIIQAGFTPNGFDTAFQKAEAECAKYGRVAVVKSKNLLDNTLRYECVER
jgi:hypothetical protein